MDLHRLVGDFRQTGFDGMINFPTTGPSGSRNRDRSSVGLGLDRDFEMIKIARDQDYFTICYGYTEEQTIGLAAVGADVIVGHAGWTTGGLAGAGASAMSLDKACEHVQKMVELAGLPIEMVLPLATEIPARILGVSDRKGKIAAGYDADLVTLTPKFEVPRVLVRGREIV